VVALMGPLGAGKTVFVRGLAEGLGLDPGSVASPSFVIACEHEAAGARLVHADLYRVKSAGEAESAGWFDWLAPGIVLAVEWADRFPELLPDDRLEVRIERGTEDVRRLEIRAQGERAHGVLGRLLTVGGTGAAASGETR
jgi:tRNA threonylcarbamoyladenosine biosynthesis protein TsaE